MEEPKTPPTLPTTAGVAAKALWVLYRIQGRIQSLALTLWGMFLPFSRHSLVERLRLATTIAVWLWMLDWFYTPVSELSVHAFVWRDLCTTWFAMAVIIALVHTLISLVPLSPLEEPESHLEDGFEAGEVLSWR